MAKKKQSQKPKVKRKAPRAPRSIGMTAYQRLLHNPCQAEVLSPYGGEKGFVQRFVQDLTVNAVAGQTAGYITYSPSNNSYVIVNVNTSGTAAAPGVFAGPGATYLGANAAKVRGIAACITIIPAATSYNTLTGEIGCFATSSNTLSGIGGATYAPDGVLQLCNTRTVLAKREYEVKWFPGSLDHTYASASGTSGTFVTSEDADVNMIGFVWRGYPSGTPLNVRITTVVEWTPKQALGIAGTSTPGYGINHADQAAALHQAHPGWWNSLAHNMIEDASAVARNVGRRGMAMLGSAAERAMGSGLQALERNVMRVAGNAMPLLLTL